MTDDHEAVRLKLANEACCRVTGNTGKLDAHRLVPGGPYTPENIMPLDHAFHVYELHQGKNTRAASALVRAVMMPDEEAFIVRIAGKGWLEARYPKP